MNASEQSLHAQERAQVYWLLSALCMEAPSVEFLAELTTAARVPDCDSPYESLLTDDITDALQGDDGLAGLQQQLAQEFVSLFHPLLEDYGPPPPCESVYIQAADPLAVISSVADFYRQAGFSNIPDVNDQPDHLGTELRFLALLAMAEADALKSNEAEDSDRYQKLRISFLDRHIGTWIAECCQTLHKATAQPFYRNLVATVANIISIDRAALLKSGGC